MTVEEAARILREMYVGSDKGEMVLQCHLFGITYADELDRLSVREILEVARLPTSYSTEISKGRKLAKYVAPRGSDGR